MREDALPQPVSPYGVTQAGGRAAVLPVYRELRGADRLAAVLHRVRPAAAAGHGLPPVPARDAARASRSRVFGDGEQTRDFTFVDDAVERDDRGGAAGVPGRVYNIGGGSRVSRQRGARDDRPRVGPAADSSTRSRPEGRHAAHFADTSLAQHRSRVQRRASALEEGLAAEYQWLVRHRCETLTSRRLVRSSSVGSSAVAWRRHAPPTRPRRRAAGTARAGQVSLRHGQRGARAEEVADRARVLQAGRPKPTPQSPLGRTPSWRSATPISAKAPPRRWSWRSTSSGSSCRSTRPTTAPTTRSTSWRWRTSGRCGRRSATRPRRATPSGSSRHSSPAIPNSEPDAGGQGASCARRGIG